MVTRRFSRFFEKDETTMWRYVSNFGDAQLLFPHVVSTILLTKINRAVGARRRLEYVGGGSSEEVVTVWNEAAKRFTTQQIFGSYPVKGGQILNAVATTWSVEKIEEPKNCCKVIYEVTLSARKIVGGKIAILTWLWPRCRRLAVQMFDGLEFYSEYLKKLMIEDPNYSFAVQ